MTEIGALASEFHGNTLSLRELNTALRYLKDSEVEKGILGTESLNIVLSVLEPISATLNGKLSSSLKFDQDTVVQILKRRHEKNWQRYRLRITQLTSKLENPDPKIEKEEFDLLNDVADAIDTQCAYLFKRMSGRI